VIVFKYKTPNAVLHPEPDGCPLLLSEDWLVSRLFAGKERPCLQAITGHVVSVRQKNTKT